MLVRIRSITVAAIAMLCAATGFAHSGDEPPLFVSDSGLDEGSCQLASSPCRSIEYALARLGKGAQIRVATGSYIVDGEEELFQLLHGTVDIQGGFSTNDDFLAPTGSPSILAGVPREYAEALAERGFFIAADSKVTERSVVTSVEKQLATHRALQKSMSSATCSGGSVNGMPCLNMDLLSHVGSADISANPGDGADVWGFVDLNTNREYAIVGFSRGTAVFDVTDAENPREVGFVDGQTTVWRDIKVYQYRDMAADRWRAHAYVTTDGSTDGLFVIDLSGLPHTIERVDYASDFSAAHNVYATNTDFGTGLSVTGAVPTVVVAGSNNGAGPYRAYSVNEPSAPEFEVMPGSGVSDYMHDAASMMIDDNRKDTQCANATIYCEILFDFNEDTIDVWDITATGSPVRLSSTVYANRGYVHSGWWSEDKQYLFVHDELDEQRFGLNTTVRVYELSNLGAPASVATWTGPTAAIDHNGFVRGNRYYMSNYARGITVLDITNVTDIQEVGYLDTYPALDSDSFVGAWGAYPFFHSGSIAVSDIDSGFYMVADRTLDVAEGRLALTSYSYGGTEGTTLQIPVSRNGGSTGAVSVGYEILGATANASDVGVASGVLNWSNGDIADKTIFLNLLADTDNAEGLERLFVKLVAPTGGATLDPLNVANVYIAEAGAGSSIGFAESAITIAERGFATAVVVFHRSGSASGAVSVDYSMTAGNATAGTDFQGNSTGTVSWGDGDANPKFAEFVIEDDGAPEDDEMFELTLQNASGASIGATASIEVTIADGAGTVTAPNAVVRAGATVRPGDLVSLDGSASNDPDGDSITYQWTQVAGPTVALSGADQAIMSFTAPDVASATLLQFELQVSDGALTDVTTTSVTVRSVSGGGGGGSFGWVSVLLFALTLLRRKHGFHQLA